MNDVVTADKVTAYGDRAVAQGTRVAQVPQQQKGKAKAPAKPPAHVAAARSIWQSHFAGTLGGPVVAIEDLSRAPSPAIKRSAFAAWTNSGTAVFVSKASGTDPAALLVILHHELEHVVDFRKHGNAPPVDYAAMMTFECRAYGASTTMTAGHPDPDVQQYEPDMKTLRDLFCKTITTVTQQTQDPKARNAAYRKFLLDNNLLPAHKDIGDLYR